MRAASIIPLTVFLLACQPDDAAQRARVLDSPAARRLVGAWAVSFEVDTNMATAPQVRSSRPQVQGMLVFAPDHTGPSSTPELEGITHEGAYDLDFRPFGFTTRTAESPAVLVARIVSASELSRVHDVSDSLYVVLSPGTERFSVRMSGTLARDSGWGVWSAYAFSAGGGAGRFVMRRHVENP
jgi:hypothetical protein